MDRTFPVDQVEVVEQGAAAVERLCPDARRRPAEVGRVEVRNQPPGRLGEPATAERAT